MEQIMKELYGIELILLHSAQENIPSKLFYINNGYERIADLQDYYIYNDKTRHSAYFWRKFLNNNSYFEDIFPLSFLINYRYSCIIIIFS